MEGHYHAAVRSKGDPKSISHINEPDWEKFLNIVGRVGRANVVRVGFVCSYGCGILHNLKKDETAALARRLSRRLSQPT